MRYIRCKHPNRHKRRSRNSCNTCCQNEGKMWWQILERMTLDYHFSREWMRDMLKHLWWAANLRNASGLQFLCSDAQLASSDEKDSMFLSTAEASGKEPMSVGDRFQRRNEKLGHMRLQHRINLPPSYKPLDHVRVLAHRCPKNSTSLPLEYFTPSSALPSLPPPPHPATPSSFPQRPQTSPAYPPPSRHPRD